MTFRTARFALLRSAILSCLVAICQGAFVVSTAAADQRRPARELPLLMAEDFGDGADRWEPTDRRAWRVDMAADKKYYSQFQQSDYKPPHRSPLNISLLRDVTVGDFTLEVEVRSTARDYDHRDVCLVFGYQDPANFYYVHLGQKTDDHANQIFLVDDAPRRKISTQTTPGTPWDDQWHRVKIVRSAATGEVEVYFDDMDAPAMTARDKTFAWGRVGVGSFDDTGDWRRFRLHGVAVDRPDAGE